MWTHPYVHEKLRELETELTRRALRHAPPSPASRLTLRPLVRGAGRTLRWLGEGLESWGSPSPERTSDHMERRRGEWA